MKPIHLVAFLGLALVGPAQAEIYKSIDAEGHVTYSSSPTKGAKKLGLEPPAQPASRTAPEISASPRRPRNASTPPDFPRVDSNTQKSRDDTRRKILAAELGTEERLLAEARQNLKASADVPDYERDKDGKQVFSPRYKEKMTVLQDTVTLHEKNIAALKSELTNLK